MGFLSDVFHSFTGLITAPVNAITGLANDVTSGQDVFASVMKAAPAALNPTLGGIGVATDIKPVASVLHATPLVGADALKLGGYERSINSGNSLDTHQSWDYLKTYGKDAGIIGAGAFAASELGGAYALSGAGVAANAGKGNFKGALVGAAGLASAGGFIPESAQPFIDKFAQSGGGGSPGSPNRSPSVSGYSSTRSGYGGLPVADSGSGSMILPLAGVAIAAYFLIKKKGH